MVRYIAHCDPSLFIGKVIYNPEYPIHTCSAVGVPHGTSAIGLKDHRSKPKFRVALRKSIDKEGFRNPVTGYTCENGLLLRFGFSRLQVAQDNNLTLPAIIVDHLGRYNDYPEVTNDNFADFFTDVPRFFEINEDNTRCEHTYFLEKRNQRKYDEAGITWLGEDPTGVLAEFTALVRRP